MEQKQVSGKRKLEEPESSDTSLRRSPRKRKNVAAEPPVAVKTAAPAVVETETPASVEIEAPATVETEAPAAVEIEAPATVERDVADAVEIEAPAIVETEASAAVQIEASATVETDAADAVEIEAPATVEVDVPAAVETEDPATEETESPTTKKSRGSRKRKIVESEIPSASETYSPCKKRIEITETFASTSDPQSSTDSKKVETDILAEEADLITEIPSLYLDAPLEEKKRILAAAKRQPGVKGKLVFLYDPNSNAGPISILQSAGNAIDMPLRLSQYKAAIKSKIPHYNLLLGNEIIASGMRESKSAMQILSSEAFDDLQRYCFSILQKARIGPIVETDGSIRQVKPQSTETTSKSEPSIAEKMMMKMGWTGGGLGAQEQGIVDTIELQEQVNKLGLGASKVMGSISKIFADFAKSNSIDPLLFSKDFTKEERKQLHELAVQHHLRSKSYGKNEDRQLVVYCRLNRFHIVERLIEEGGETDNYKLIFPTDL